MVERPDLLTPVLGEEQPRERLFSVRAEFLTAFFGGPLAILLLSAMNADFLGRLKTDLWRYLLLGSLSIAVMGWLAYLRIAEPSPAWLTDSLGTQANNALRWTGRAYSLVVWLLLWLPYRRYHRAAELMGLEPRSPWAAAIGSIILGTGMVLVIGLIVASFAAS